MTDGTFNCGNCGNVIPASEAVSVPLTLRVLSFVLSPIPSRVCRACSGQVSALGGFAVLVGLAAAIAVLFGLLKWTFS